MLIIFGVCLLLGAVVGFLAGLLGIGGGLVIVPALVYLLPMMNVLPEHIMPMAIATSLASIIITASSASLVHHKNGNIPWLETKKILLFVGLGSLAGAFIASSLPANLLKIIFAVFVMLIASYMIASINVEQDTRKPSDLSLKLVGTFTGSIASILGIAGGAILVPTLTYLGMPMRSSISIATVSGVFIAIFGVIGFVIMGAAQVGLPDYSVGYVYFPALIGIIITSALFAPVGVKMAAKLPTKTLKKIFAFFLIIVALKMIFD